MKILSLVLAAMTSFASTFALARAYGEAGCGLGSLVIGKDGNQILAATTNDTGIQSFGITSGTSNCTDDGAVASNKQVIMYIEVNKTALANEAAKGNGETISGLANLLKVDQDEFKQTLKENYKKIFVETQMQPVAIKAEIESLVHGS